MKDKKIDQDEQFKKDFIENFKNQRKDMQGSGGLFETFFSTAEPEFIDHYQKKIADYALVGKKLLDLVMAADSDSALKSKLEKRFQDIAMAQNMARKVDPQKEDE